MATVPTGDPRANEQDDRDPGVAIFRWAGVGALFWLGVWAALA